MRLVGARNPESPEFEAARRHVAEGCASCAERLEFLRRADCDRAAPPETPATWVVPRRVAREADTRAGILADHQLVCGAGSYELDVIVRELDVPERLDIGGQVTQAVAIHEPARDVPLVLLDPRGPGIVSATRTDEFGEFEFHARRGICYGLRVGDRRDAPCVLVWDGGA